MIILIAGATGLIGNELVRQCHEMKIIVHYLTTRKEKIESTDDYKGFYWNPLKKIIDVAAFKGVTAIVNLAGVTVSKRWTESHKQAILQSRVEASNLLYAALNKTENQVRHYIVSSGISIYKSSLFKTYHEDDSISETSFLSKVVVAWEAASDQISNLNIKVAKLRTGIVLHSSEGALPKIAKPIQMGVGAPLGNGKQWQSWIHVEDIAAIFLYIIKRELSGVYNGVAPVPVTHTQMLQVISTRLKKRLIKPKIPAFMLKLLLGEMSDLVLESQKVSAEKIENTGYRFKYKNLEEAVANLI